MIFSYTLFFIVGLIHYFFRKKLKYNCKK